MKNRTEGAAGPAARRADGPSARTVMSRVIAAAIAGLLVIPSAIAAPLGRVDTVPRWLPPAPLVVVGAFDPPQQKWLSGHRGVDLAAEPGMPVRTPADGVVSFAGSIAGRPVLAIRHGTIRSTYEPVISDLPMGTAVSAGEVVGRVAGGTGHCGSGACLHWGAIIGDAYVDPLALLVELRPRLLPLVGDPS